MPDKLRNYLEIFCVFRSGFIASCVYNLLLILACCYYAFRTRKVPSNYNESKFIAASVYSTMLLVSAAALVYSTVSDVATMKAAFCVVVLLNAYLTLACVYLPKLYAVRFVRDFDVLGVCTSTANAADEVSRASVITVAISRRGGTAVCPEPTKPSA